VPIKINRAMSTLLVRDIEAGIRAAVAAGHPPPPVELRHLDGLSRAESAALTRWASGIPEIGRALRDRRHPQHAEIAAMRDLVQHFSTEHPARADGSPEPWNEPISEPLLSYAMGDRSSIDAGELTPAEAGAMLNYSTIRGDLTAARLDGKHPQHGAVQAEIEALAARASEARAPSPASAAAESGGAGQMTEQEAQARSDVLNAALQGKMTGVARAQAANELMELHEVFPHLQPFSTKGMSADELAALKTNTTRFVPHELSDRGRELVEGLWDGKYAGPRRHPVVSELMTELSRGAPSSVSASSSPAASGPAASPSPAPTGPRVDIRSDRSRSIAAGLAGLKGAARRAGLESLAASLAADQEASDAGAAGSA
jgi:hypothetical protein